MMTIILILLAKASLTLDHAHGSAKLFSMDDRLLPCIAGNTDTPLERHNPCWGVWRRRAKCTGMQKRKWALVADSSIHHAFEKCK